jgi:IS30 family transposase
MGCTYNHLNLEERVKLDALRNEGLSYRQIARWLGQSASSLCREYNRNQRQGLKCYFGIKTEGKRLYRLRNRQWERRSFNYEFLEIFSNFLGSGVVVE